MASAALQRKLSEYIGELERIRSLCTPAAAADSEKIGQKISDFLDRIDMKDIKALLSPIPVRFHRQVILTSIRAASAKLKKARALLSRGSPRLSAQEISYALLWIRQAAKMTDTISFFRKILSQDLSDEERSRLFLSSGDLSKSDIVLSYKTTYYLKKSRVSQLVALATNSPITHAMLVCHERNSTPKLLVSGDATRGLGLVDPVAASGEMFIVMRPIADPLRGTRLPDAIDAWRKVATLRQETPLKSEKAKWKFAEVKCQVASAIGFCYVLSIKIFGRPLIFRNPIRDDSRLFCTELIDMIFKQAGILLSPRSEHDALLGPIEILYSPAMSLVGVIARPEDLANMEGEIRSQFFTSSPSLYRSFSGLLQNIGTHFLS